ncbi:MAG: hypothetical protein Q3976_02640 [Corynebacterium sp.]|nr:hypothetical protein [Corynebacterium sp.]
MSQEYPVYTGELRYVEGYDPVSFYAPHSSLHKLSTWSGMAFLLLILPGLGTLTFGFGANSAGSQEHWGTFVIIGAVFTVICLALGSWLIYYGRRDYRKYAKETGRTN